MGCNYPRRLGPEGQLRRRVARCNGRTNPDEEFQTGRFGRFRRRHPADLRRHISREGFVEARLPLIDDHFLAQSLALETGYRYSDYNLGFKTNTYKFGVEWSPISDIRLRGSFQRAVRAPNVTELFRRKWWCSMATTILVPAPLRLAAKGISWRSASRRVCRRRPTAGDPKHGQSVQRIARRQPGFEPGNRVDLLLRYRLDAVVRAELALQIDYFDIKIEKSSRHWCHSHSAAVYQQWQFLQRYPSRCQQLAMVVEEGLRRRLTRERRKIGDAGHRPRCPTASMSVARQDPHEPGGHIRG